MILDFALIISSIASAPADFQSYRAHIEAARASLIEDNSARAIAWLQDAPKKFRGWEWDYLMCRCGQSTAKMAATSAGITRMQTSPDGTLLAVADTSGKVTLWDTRSLRSRGVLQSHEQAVYGLDFSPDGNTIVTTSGDNTIRLWDARLATEIGKLGDHPVTPYHAAFSPDGKRVVSVGWRSHEVSRTPVGLIRVWDVAARKMLASKDYTTHPISSIAFSADGKTCFVGCWEYQVGLFDMEKLEVVREIWPEASDTYKAVDWIEPVASGRQLLTASKDKRVRLWDVESGQTIQSFDHRGNVTSVRFAPRSESIVSASQDGTLRVFATDGSRAPITLHGHQRAVTALAITRDGTRAFSGDGGGAVLTWDLSDLRAFSKEITFAGAWSCKFSPDGKFIAVGTNESTIQVVEVQTMKRVWSSGKYDALVVDTAWSPDGRRVAAGSNDGSIRAFEIATSKELWQIPGKGQVRTTIWSADGKFVAGGAGASGQVSLIEAETGRVLHQFATTPGTLCLAFSPDARRIAIASGKTLELYDVATRKQLGRTTNLASRALDLAFSPSGTKIAVGEEAGQVEMVSVRNLFPIWTAKTSGSQWGVAFSPDETRLASTGYDYATHLWDVKLGLEVFAWRDQAHTGFDVHFSPDGRQVGQISGSGHLQILERNPTRETVSVNQ